MLVCGRGGIRGGGVGVDGDRCRNPSREMGRAVQPTKELIAHTMKSVGEKAFISSIFALESNFLRAPRKAPYNFSSSHEIGNARGISAGTPMSSNHASSEYWEAHDWK